MGTMKCDASLRVSLAPSTEQSLPQGWKDSSDALAMPQGRGGHMVGALCGGTGEHPPWPGRPGADLPAWPALASSPLVEVRGMVHGRGGGVCRLLGAYEAQRCPHRPLSPSRRVASSQAWGRARRGTLRRARAAEVGANL